MRILIVGAGFSGAVHARECAERGHDVTLIDKRDHIAGNAYDYVSDGVRLHRYGPHLFHTNNIRVVDWLSRYTDWLPYQHRARARLEDGRLVPFPINRQSVEMVTGGGMAILPMAATGKEPDARSYLIKQIGPELTELFFQRYTEKMWGISLEEMAADVVRRVRVRRDDEDRYFPDDTFQALPANGYTALFEEILRHARIDVVLETAFNREMEARYDFIFNGMAIDEYYDYVFGRLPYRSIRFHHRTLEADPSQGWVTINYTDASPFTRETYWHNLPGHRVAPGRVVRTIEEPCSYEENDYERYYPIKTSDNRYARAYGLYHARATASAGKMRFIGRCGTYQYLDMHQVVMQSLTSAQKWLGA